MSSSLEACRELLGDLEVDGRKLTIEEEQEIDEASELLLSLVQSHMDEETGAVNLRKGLMSEASAVLAEHASSGEQPGDHIVYGGVLLATATLNEIRYAEAWL